METGPSAQVHNSSSQTIINILISAQLITALINSIGQCLGSYSFLYDYLSLALIEPLTYISTLSLTYVLPIDRLRTADRTGTRPQRSGPDRDRTTVRKTGPPLLKRSGPHH